MIAAIDPGTHLAIAWVKGRPSIQDLHKHLRTKEFQSYVPEKAPADLIYRGELEMVEQAAAYLIPIILRSPTCHLLIEDFTTRMLNKGRAFLSPVRTTMALLAILRQNELTFNFSLPPASTMANVTDERLKKLGLWTPGSKHVRAATKHLVSQLRR